MTLVSTVSVFSATQVPIQMQKVRDSVRKSNIDGMKKAIDEYYQDTNCYPQTIPTCKNPLALGDLLIKDNIPCDPSTKLSYTYVPEINECPQKFQLYANLEYLSDKIIDRVGCRYGCGPECQFNFGVASSNQNLNPFCTENVPPASQTETPAPTSAPHKNEGEHEQFVCSPSGVCEEYERPEYSGCPDIYLNDPNCQNACSDKKNRCHDARGKR